MTRIAAYVPDLMDRSKVSAAAPGTTVVARPELLADVEADVFVLDLTRAGVLDVIPLLTGRIIGFANHTSRELMDDARAAGCGEVMARSDFFAGLAELLESGASN